MNENIKSFDTQSAEYAKSRPRYPAKFYKFLVNQLESHDALWDCACGNGQVAIDLAEHFNQVYATDISETQMKNAFKHPKINYSVSPSEKTAFENDFFDAICVAQAVHWFQLEEFFKEVDRVLKPNGILAIFGYGFPKINIEIDAIVDKKLHSEINEFWSSRNRMIISGFKDVEFPFKKIETPTFSMEQQWSLDATLIFFDTWSAVKRYNETHRTNIGEKLKNNLLSVWKPGETKNVKMGLYCFLRRK